jgi:hypothetical protein
MKQFERLRNKKKEERDFPFHFSLSHLNEFYFDSG